jgi:hypothetical protein
MARPPHDPELVAECIRLVRAGNSVREVAAAAGVSFASVARWAREADKAPAVPEDVKARAKRLVERSAAPAEPATPPPPEVPDDAPALEQVRGLIRWLNHARREAERDPAGPQWAVVQRTLSAIARIMPTLKQLEQIEAQNHDVVTISKADLTKAEAEIERRILALTGGPIYCGDCRMKLFG